MVHLRNGTPEHRVEYHLLLSDLIPFDQNNCRRHRYHQLCHGGGRHRGPPSPRACSGSEGIRSLDQITCESLHLRKSLRPSLLVITIVIALMPLTLSSPAQRSWPSSLDGLSEEPAPPQTFAGAPGNVSTRKPGRANIAAETAPVTR